MLGLRINDEAFKISTTVRIKEIEVPIKEIQKKSKAAATLEKSRLVIVCNFAYKVMLPVFILSFIL